MAKKKKKREKKAKKQLTKSIRYQCLECGIEESIPRGTVELLDILEGDGDLTDPPNFECEKCGGIMEAVDKDKSYIVERRKPEPEEDDGLPL